MKYKPVYWFFITPFIKHVYLRKRFDRKTTGLILKNAKAEYKRLIAKADDIGANNPMASNLYSALLFVSFHTANPDLITAETLVDMMESLLNLPLLKKINPIDLNHPNDMQKLNTRIRKHAAWAEKHKHQYPETWEFNFDDSHRDGCYYYFTKCPIAKFFKDNHMEHLTPHFCALDYITIGANRGRLIRNHTLAQGDEMCDFWIVGDRVKDPQ